MLHHACNAKTNFKSKECDDMEFAARYVVKSILTGHEKSFPLSI